MFVMSTAGHIDHGKSALIHALTGIDPDRLREEKERGMTIDLGFAWLKLPSGREVGIVDVPGHERFIGNMLAGVGGVDLVLLVVAANEGVMPQTREHVAILDLLGIKKGIVAITKKDLVDDEWLGLVMTDVEELLKSTRLDGSPLIPVSAVTGEGLKELSSCIDNLLNVTEPRKDLGRPRLPVDRVFTIAGAGTVVTGTLIDGSLEVGQEVEVVPRGIKTRIRSLQVHKTRTEIAYPGSRVAANLVGVTVEELHRGDVLSRPGTVFPVSTVTARLRLLRDVRHVLRHSVIVTFYSGAAETIAKVRLLEGDELKAGESSWAQFVLDRPLALVTGDHYVIRSTVETLGGGEIVDTSAKILRRSRPDIISGLRLKEEGTTADKIYALIEAKQPVEPGSLIAQTEMPSQDVEVAIRELVQQERVMFLKQGERQWLITVPFWSKVRRMAVDILQEYHSKWPLRPGMPREELRNKLKLGNASPVIMSRLVEDKIIIESGAEVSLPSFRVQLTSEQQSRIDAFLRDLARNPFSPQTNVVLEPDLLNLLVQQKKVVKVSAETVFLTEAYNQMVQKVVDRLKEKGRITLAEVRDLLRTSRKYAQALLEYMDGQKITRRIGDDRVLL